MKYYLSFLLSSAICTSFAQSASIAKYYRDGSEAQAPILQKSAPAALESTEQHSILLYPNPVSGNRFHIRSPLADKNLRMIIYSPDGRNVLEQPLTGTETEIDAAGWSAGVYTVRIIGDGISESIKLPIF